MLILDPLINQNSNNNEEHMTTKTINKFEKEKKSYRIAFRI
jgi:hypothetical protein